MKIKKLLKNLNYRHYISVAITLCFVVLTVFQFPNALGRLIESFRDFSLSISFMFCEFFYIPNNITPTVINLPKIPFFNFGGQGGSPSTPSLPGTSLPDTWQGFQSSWSLFWNAFVTKDNIIDYIIFLSDLLYLFCFALLIIIPFIILLLILFNNFMKNENNNYNEDSKPLKVFKKLSKFIYQPAKNWLVEFLAFIKKNSFYLKLWLVIWLFNFNIITIIVEFFAFYFYFVITFDLASIYFQVYKLFLDLSVPFKFIPVWIWIIICLIIFDYFRKKIAFSRLRHMELKNRGFINARPIVTMTCGSMGKKKTTAVVDMALSQEAMFRDKAFAMILENDLKFPNFPWINLENEIKKGMERHQIYNLATCRLFVENWKKWFTAVNSDKAIFKSWRRHLKKHAAEHKYHDLIFNYDYEQFGFTYDDKLKVVDIWSVLETYAQLYFIYLIESSLVLANLSVRVDNIKKDLGNFPLWNTDFFKRDSRLLKSFSRHAHILDFDALRLGRKLIENNIRKDVFEFGVVVITEIGKERGNTVELKEVKKKGEETNQKNDLFNVWLKMIRHSATVDNFPFVKVFTDEQRPSSWGADARDLCEIVHIKESSDTHLAMPFFALEELLYSFLFGSFKNLYYDYRHSRGDNTLFMYLVKGVSAKVHQYYKHIYNRFSYCQLKVRIEDGVMDGNFAENNYYIMSKKIYSKRFSTDCYSGFFTNKALRSEIGLNDLEEYATEKASFNELRGQDSYFINDLVNTENKDKN